MSIIKFLVQAFVFIPLLVFPAQAQTDTVSSEASPRSTLPANEDPRQRIDTTDVVVRAFSSTSLKKLKEDPELQYEQPPTIGESLWQRFKNWLLDLFRFTIDSAINTNWGKLVVYALLTALLIIVILLILKVDAFRLFYRSVTKGKQYQVLEENIHEMDFDQLIREAVESSDFRKGVRLLFLYALKILSDQQFIHWESGKTNRDYLAELRDPELKTGFSALSTFFEYAWYGNFSIDRHTFERAQHQFVQWKSKVATR